MINLKKNINENQGSIPTLSSKIPFTLNLILSLKYFSLLTEVILLLSVK